MIPLLIVLLWLACAVPTYGITFGYFQTEYPEFTRVHRWFAPIFAVLGGPITLMTAYALSDRVKHGMIFRVPSDEGADARRYGGKRP